MSLQVPTIVYDGAAPRLSVAPVRPSIPAGPPSAPPAATATLSHWAVILSKLQQVHETDPAAFGPLATRLAEAVKTAASSASGDDKPVFTKLADDLGRLAKTGDLGALRPPKHHHHHAPAAHSGSGLPSLLESLLEQIDHVLGPGATSPSAT